MRSPPLRAAAFLFVLGTGYRDLSSSSAISPGMTSFETRSRSAGTITLQNGATVSGTQRQHTSVQPYREVTLNVDFDAPSQGPVHLEPPNGSEERVTTLLPGRYSSVVIKSRNRVNLSTGSYQFDSLDLEPQSRFVVDDAAGPVLVDVRDSLLFKGSIEGASGDQPAFRLVYVGTNSPAIETAFTGALIVPNASMRLATPPDRRAYSGTFVSRDLEVSPDARVVLRPFFRYDVVERWNQSATSWGDVASVMDAPDGATLFATERRLYRREPSGSLTDLTGTDLNCRIRFDPSSGRWACGSGGPVILGDSQGVLLGQYDSSDAVGMRVVPPTGDIALFVGTAAPDRAAAISALRITGPSGTTSAPVSNPVAIAAAADVVAYSTGTDLVRMSRDGSVVWTVPVALRQLILSDDGSTLMGMRNQPGSHVVHVDMASGAVLGEEDLAHPMRELHFSPNGARSVAATKTTTVSFASGMVTDRRTLPIAQLTSAAISDAGDVVVGGIDSAGTAVIRCDGPAGAIGWSVQLEPDDRAYRPYVTMARTAGGFYAITREALFSYGVSRRFQ